MSPPEALLAPLAALVAVTSVSADDALGRPRPKRRPRRQPRPRRRRSAPPEAAPRPAPEPSRRTSLTGVASPTYNVAAAQPPAVLSLIHI